MVEPHGVLGVRSPNRSARTLFARLVAILCALLPAMARAADPVADSRREAIGGESPDPFAILNYGKSERLPPVEPAPMADSPGAAADERLWHAQ